jgi:hypothetical protein
MQFGRFRPLKGGFVERQRRCVPVANALEVALRQWDLPPLVDALRSMLSAVSAA